MSIRERVAPRSLDDSEFWESCRGASALERDSWFPAGPESGSAVTQGLRPRLSYVAPSGLDYGGGVAVCRAEATISSPIPVLELGSDFFTIFLTFLKDIYYDIHISTVSRLQPTPVLLSRTPALPFARPRFLTSQSLCSQDFACNLFLFIDLAGTLSPRLNRFIDLRGNAIFFQE